MNDLIRCFFLRLTNMLKQPDLFYLFAKGMYNSSADKSTYTGYKVHTLISPVNHNELVKSPI